MNARQPLFVLVAALGLQAQSLNPPYLRDMPSIERVLSDMQASYPAETAARQMAALLHLKKIVDDAAGPRFFDRRVGLTPDETRIRQDYYTAYYRIFQSKEEYKKSNALGGYDVDPRFRNELLKRYFPPAFRAQVDNANAASDARARARNQANKQAAEAMLNQPTTQVKPTAAPPAVNQPDSGGSVGSQFVSDLTAAPVQDQTIKDPTEDNAYTPALNTKDPAQRAAALEVFVNRYPNSTVKLNALEQAMAAFQLSGNEKKTVEMATRILAINPNNVLALGISVGVERAELSSDPKGSARLNALRARAIKGLAALSAWTPNLSPAEFEKYRAPLASIFNSAVAFAAFKENDWAVARDYYVKSLVDDPDEFQNTYQLAIAELEMNPLDATGFWYAARAVHQAGKDTNQVNTISRYATAKYKQYHGSMDGWDQIVALASTQSAPLAKFAASIKPASSKHN